jgi:hypothetical protein
MGRKTYLGGSTVLRFSPKARNAWLETGPNAAEGEANVERAERKRALAKQQAIDAMNKRDARKVIGKIFYELDFSINSSDRNFSHRSIPFWIVFRDW